MIDSVSGVWDLAEIYDFAYDINSPIEIESETEDVIAILRKK